MAKDKPTSGPAGNTDDNKRGRGISGRPSKGAAQSPGNDKTSRSNDDPDTDGYSVGGRGR
jgi:hypothetical protein